MNDTSHPHALSITLDNRTFDAPHLRATEGSDGVDVSAFRKSTGRYLCDNGFNNTAAGTSAITFINGEKGILRHRGYDIEELAEHCKFVEVAYLLVHGKLPDSEEIQEFSSFLNEHSMIHQDMQHFFTGLPQSSHPMSILSATINTLSSFYPHIMTGDQNFDETAARLISKVRTIAAYSYKKSLGHPYVFPRGDLSYCANFLNMMFSLPIRQYELDPDFIDILNKLLILHIDHEQNCSTLVVRSVASAHGNLYAAISAGISALSGPLHGGANQAVIEMLQNILADGGDITKYIEKAKNREDSFRLMGFGHSVYKTYDPRARIARKLCDDLFTKKGINDPLLELAKKLEERALSDEYFIEKNLYPNIDFYTGILYRATGIPTNMLTVMFAIGRLPGWISHWKETYDNAKGKIYRPRQIYNGPTHLPFVPIQQR